LNGWKQQNENKGIKTKLLLCKSIWPASFQTGMKFMLRLGSWYGGSGGKGDEAHFMIYFWELKIFLHH
jgi:hypothetical protein